MKKYCSNSLLGGLLTFTFIAGMTLPANAETLAYWRLGDDTSITTDSSGNGNTLSGNATVYSLPATGTGSAFSNPIPQNGLSNTLAGSFDGSNGGNSFAASDFLTQTVGFNFTVEGYFNRQATLTRTQYIVAHSRSVSGGRSWSIGVAASGGTGGAGGNELFFLPSADGNNASLIPLGLTTALDHDYYFALAYNNSSNTNDITFYYQDLTAGGPLQVSTISSGITTLQNNGADIEIGAFNAGNNNFGGVIDEIRISSGLLAQSDLIIIPEPSTYALLAGIATIGLVVLPRRRG